MRIVISPLEGVRTVVARWPGAYLCGLLGPEMDHPALPLAEERRLRLTFNDISGRQGLLRPPEAEHVGAIIAFARGWAAARREMEAEEARGAPLAFHCWAGISRSAAAGFIAAAALRPRGREAELARSLRRAAPKVTPNRRMVALADELLGREGRMTEAIAAIGRGREAAWGDVVEWRLPEEEVDQPPM